MGLIDSLKSAIVTQGFQQGVTPTERRPGLRDPTLPGESGADRLAPNFILVINKETMPEDITKYITEITYEDNEELFDQMTITLEGVIFDPLTQQNIPIPTWIQSSSIFSEGNICWVYMGYGAYVRLIGGAEIVKREFNYNQDNPTCKIICYEPLHRMANTFAEKATSYFGMRSSDIVKKIAKKKEYSGAIGALFNTDLIDRLPIFTPRAEIQKQGESDYQFLRRMADVRGWALFTRFDERTKKFNLYYGPDVDKSTSVFRYEYNAKTGYAEDNLLSFTPEINTIDQSAEIEIISVDETKKKKVSSTQKYQPLADGGGISRKFTTGNVDFPQGELKNPTAYRFKAFGLNKRIISNRPFKDESECKKFIINWARETIKNFITGGGKVAGNEDIQSRQNILLMNLGETFSGTESKPAKWYLTKVVHKIGGGGDLTYETSFDVRKSIDWLPNDDITANLASLANETGAGKYVPL